MARKIVAKLQSTEAYNPFEFTAIHYWASVRIWKGDRQREEEEWRSREGGGKNEEERRKLNSKLLKKLPAQFQFSNYLPNITHAGAASFERIFDLVGILEIPLLIFELFFPQFLKRGEDKRKSRISEEVMENAANERWKMECQKWFKYWTCKWLQSLTQAAYLEDLAPLYDAVRILWRMFKTLQEKTKLLFKVIP